MKDNKQHIVLKTEELSIGYRQKNHQKFVAQNINLSIEKGKFIAVLGKNGIGKSTLLRTISKVQDSLDGNIILNNKNILEYTSKDFSTLVSLVLTERLPESQLTVFELVALGRQPYTNWIDSLSKKDLEKVHWAVEQTEIDLLKNNRFYELSDGQLQRVLIARALAQDTEIIILDEPTAHLDIHHTFKVFSLLKKLVETTQKTIIISTHEVNLAIQLADELVLLSEKNVYSGNPEALIDQNAFDELFPSELIKFNRTLQQFIINKNE